MMKGTINKKPAKPANAYGQSVDPTKARQNSAIPGKSIQLNTTNQTNFVSCQKSLSAFESFNMHPRYRAPSLRSECKRITARAASPNASLQESPALRQKFPRARRIESRFQNVHTALQCTRSQSKDR